MAAAAGGGGQPGPGMASNRLSASLVGNEAPAASAAAAAQSPKLARSGGGGKSSREDMLARELRASDWRLKQLRKVRSVELDGLPEPACKGPAAAEGDAACLYLLPAHDPPTMAEREKEGA